MWHQRTATTLSNHFLLDTDNTVEPWGGAPLDPVLMSPEPPPALNPVFWRLLPPHHEKGAPTEREQQPAPGVRQLLVGRADRGSVPAGPQQAHLGQPGPGARGAVPGGAVPVPRPLGPAGGVVWL